MTEDKLNDRLDSIDGRLANIEGQFAVISPKDVVALGQRVAAVETKSAMNGGLAGAVLGGLITFFFGHH